MIEIIISFLLIAGTFFILSGSVGIIRFPDVYTRLHAATKSSTLGVSNVLVGAFLFMYFYAETFSGKLILGIIFVLLTAPVSGHVISRAAHRSGVDLWSGSIKDAYQDDLDNVKKLKHTNRT
ncbi:monovalent cation/H(+) antiporter subunit G [Salirhabdus salicampi]|uniref:monovalent cation/H(+) antiporter subunit G n=1 Tax=Salirhabdus salicampi TaxID=476102 RepID=UPI0020C32F0B|nr:monovalent cation/H(+) antiporter subunit G [Salirhabdus salicampi]MCP8616943.1 monovalent cation/H(+) antiporter subunit G [Salirhabdus salicampi]